MKKFYFLIFLILFFNNFILSSYTDIFRRIHERQDLPQKDNDFNIEKFTNINKELLNLIEEFPHGFVGLEIIDLNNNVIFSHNSNNLFIPASLTKLITSYAILEVYDTNYNFKTVIYADSIISNNYYGNIYIKGYGDPTLTIEEYKNLLYNGLKKNGIDRIYGNIYFDFSLYEAENFGKGWMWDDSQPQISPLTIWQRNHQIFQYKTNLEIQDYLMFLTNSYLKELDIIFFGKYKINRTPINANVISSHNSLDLIDLVSIMNQFSDNQISETLFRNISINNYNKASIDNSINIISNLLINHFNVNHNDFIIRDGTGLSMYNLVSPSLLNKILLFMYNNENYSLLDILAHPKNEGTLKNRFDFNVYGKTGTLINHSGIMGIIITQNNNKYIFSLIENNYSINNIDVKAFENKIINFIFNKY